MHLPPSNVRLRSSLAPGNWRLLLVLAAAMAWPSLPLPTDPAHAQPGNRPTSVAWWVKVTSDLARSTLSSQPSDPLRIAFLKVNDSEVLQLRALLEGDGEVARKELWLTNYPALIQSDVESIANCQLLVVGPQVDSRQISRLLRQLPPTNILTVGLGHRQFTGLRGGMVALHSEGGATCEINQRHLSLAQLTVGNDLIQGWRDAGIRVIEKN